VKLKTFPEDFRVVEHSSFPLDGTTGKYVYVRLTKKNWNTASVVKEIAHALHISLKHIGYAGNKDKHAITQQYLSLPTSVVPGIKTFTLDDVTLEIIGYGDERLTLGDLDTNTFTIIVRQLTREKDLTFDKIKNYFGDQRFGHDNQNITLGKLLLQGNFKEVCLLLDLEVVENNYIQALHTIDKRTLRLYIAAYQSHLWNLVATTLDEGETLEIVGFLTEYSTETIQQQYETLLAKDDLTKDSFILKSYKELSMEGDKRPLFIAITNFNATWVDDTAYQEKKQCTLTFTLGKGSYATTFVNTLFH